MSGTNGSRLFVLTTYKNMTFIYIILAIIVILIIWFIASYNGFITLVNRAKESWADIDVQLKRRYDLIPNLVNTVQGYAAHEKTTFENISAARSAAMSAGAASAGTPNIAARAQAEGALSGALGKLFAVAEAYPELKANQNFLDLQSQLTDTENKIQAARRFYNINVRDLDIKIERFPSNIIAGMFGIQKMSFFELGDSVADQAARNAPLVKF
jgi:LemA protein